MASLNSRANGLDNPMIDHKVSHTDAERSRPASIVEPKHVYAADNIPMTPYSTSASSCLTTSDSSSAPSAELLSPTQQRGAMLDRLMEYFFTIHMRIHKTGHGRSSTSNTPAFTSSTQTTSSDQAGGAARRSGLAKGKRPLPSQAEGNESDSEAEDKQSSPKRRRGQESQLWKYACPFFKRDPQRYMERRACVGPGFKDVHRLKQVFPPTLSPPPVS